MEVPCMDVALLPAERLDWLVNCLTSKRRKKPKPRPQSLKDETSIYEY